MLRKYRRSLVIIIGQEDLIFQSLSKPSLVRKAHHAQSCRQSYFVSDPPLSPRGILLVPLSTINDPVVSTLKPSFTLFIEHPHSVALSIEVHYSQRSINIH